MGDGRLAAVAVALVASVVACSAGEERATPPSSTGTAAADRLLVVELSGRPSAVAHADGVVWIADDERGVVIPLGVGDGSPAGEPIPVSPHPTSIAAGAGAVWTADPNGTVTRIATATGTIDHPLRAGGVLVDVVVDGDRVWVGDIEAGTVRSIDAATGELGRPVVIPDGVVRMAVADGVLWVTGREDTVTPVDVATGTVGAPVQVGMGPIGLAAGAGAIWVANSDDDSVSRLDRLDGRPLGAPIAVGPAPVDVAIDGDDVWVLDQDGPTLTRLSSADGSPRGAAVELPTRPRGFTVTGRGVWVVGVDPPAAVLVSAP